MTIYGWLIFALWLTLVGYWIRAATVAMPKIGSRWIWWREIAIRLGFFALVVVAVQVGFGGDASLNGPLYRVNASTPIGVTGWVLCMLGIGLAILARAYLGPNWGGPLSSRDSELITTGPYALARHPLYGGLLLAMLGSAIGQSLLWLLPLVVYGPQFIRSARREEALLIGQFPESYPAYMKRTRMLLPFVL